MCPLGGGSVKTAECVHSGSRAGGKTKKNSLYVCTLALGQEVEIKKANLYVSVCERETVDLYQCVSLRHCS